METLRRLADLMMNFDKRLEVTKPEWKNGEKEG